MLTTIGFHIDFYCDNNKKEGLVIKNGVKTVSLNELYSLKDKILVFITVRDEYQDSIKCQLEENGIWNTVRVDYFFLQTFAESLFEMNDQNINKEFRCVLDDDEYLCRQFEYHVGYRPDLSNPQTFNEKIQWLKLHDRKPEYIRMVDKNAVKGLIAQQIGKKYINPTIGIWNSFDEIDFSELPNSFVLKCTHDSGSVVLCRDKKDFDKKQIKKFLDSKLSVNYFWFSREWPYKGVDRKIIAENYLENQSGEGLIDYKFLCAEGKVKYIFTCSERGTKAGLCVNFYERDWTPLLFERHYRRREKEIEKPGQLTEMIELAEKLSAGLRFIRVDFFIVDEQIYFSELTFYPGGGWEEFTPPQWDRELGKIIKI